MKTVALGEVSTQIRGVSYKKSDVRSSPADGYVPLLRGGNIGPYGLILDDLQYVPKTVVTDKQMLQAGDIVVVASSGSKSVVGKAATVRSFDGTFGAFCKVLRPSPAVDPRYFAHFFSAPEYRREVSRLSEGANINNLKNEHLDELLFQLPSKADQQRIADILDKADALRAKRREAIAHLDSLGQSIFHEMFATEHGVRLDEFAEFRYGTSNKSGPEGVACLRIPNVVSGEIDYSNMKNVPVSQDELERLRLKKGDLLFVRSNGNPDAVGRSSVFTDEDRKEYIYASYLIRARLIDTRLLPHYLQGYLSSPKGQRALRAGARTSAGQYNINTKALGSLLVPVPAKSAQEEYVLRIGKVKELRDRYREELLALDVLFASLQDRAFKGGL